MLTRSLLLVLSTLVTISCSDKNSSQAATDSSVYGTWFLHDLIENGKSIQHYEDENNYVKVNQDFSITLAEESVTFSKECLDNKDLIKKAPAVVSATQVQLFEDVDTSCDEGSGEDPMWKKGVWEIRQIDSTTLHTSNDLILDILFGKESKYILISENISSNSHASASKGDSLVLKGVRGHESTS